MGLLELGIRGLNTLFQNCCHVVWDVRLLGLGKRWACAIGVAIVVVAVAVVGIVVAHIPYAWSLVHQMPGALLDQAFVALAPSGFWSLWF